MRRLVVSMLLIVLAISLAACGGGATPAPTAAPTAVATEPAASTSSQVPATDQPVEPAAPKATPIVPLDDPSLKTTATGLKYADIVVGTGTMPAAEDWVTVEFTATLQDGTLFATSQARGGPATIPLASLAKDVAGWAEGMSTMKVGGTRQIIVPPNLAFGDQGAGGVIPPNATLVFVVNMLNTKPAPVVEFADVVVGSGAVVTSGMNIKVNFTGTLTNGTVIDAGASVTPTEFVLSEGAVMPGWVQGLPGMKVGGTRVLTIPADLAYGSQGYGEIPPNATLIYQFSLLDAQAAPQVKIEDTQVGTGAEAVPGKTVSVFYTGKLQDGTVFDSNVGKDPMSFPVAAGQMIPGFDQGVQGMKVGGKRTITIPPSLGYGAQGRQGSIPPNATLIFDVELVDVK
jgi:FKBP-type peptidyl-prolyl cis-trans isomerase